MLNTTGSNCATRRCSAVAELCSPVCDLSWEYRSIAPRSVAAQTEALSPGHATAVIAAMESPSVTIFSRVAISQTLSCRSVPPLTTWVALVLKASAIT